MRCLRQANFSYQDETWIRIEKPKPTEEEEVFEALLQLEGAPTEEEIRDKCYVHLVTLLGDLQTRMLKTFKVIAT